MGSSPAKNSTMNTEETVEVVGNGEVNSETVSDNVENNSISTMDNINNEITEEIINEVKNDTDNEIVTTVVDNSTNLLDNVEASNENVDNTTSEQSNNNVSDINSDFINNEISNEEKTDSNLDKINEITEESDEDLKETMNVIQENNVANNVANNDINTAQNNLPDIENISQQTKNGVEKEENDLEQVQNNLEEMENSSTEIENNVENTEEDLEETALLDIKDIKEDENDSEEIKNIIQETDEVSENNLLIVDSTISDEDENNKIMQNDLNESKNNDELNDVVNESVDINADFVEIIEEENNTIAVEDNNIIIANNTIAVEDNNIIIANNTIAVEDNNIIIANNTIAVEDNNIIIANNTIAIEDNNIIISNQESEITSEEIVSNNEIESNTDEIVDSNTDIVEDELITENNDILEESTDLQLTSDEMEVLGLMNKNENFTNDSSTFIENELQVKNDDLVQIKNERNILFILNEQKKNIETFYDNSNENNSETTQITEGDEIKEDNKLYNITDNNTKQEKEQIDDEFEDGRENWLTDNGDSFRYTATPPEGRFPQQNGTSVKFEAPKAPVIFVLGGPGSGKVTHCDNLMQENRSITHINMTDLLQQYTIAENKDFSQLSSKTVTEVLMLEMKMSPAAKTFLISGYPRNMRDVVEYSNKIQIVNGVVLVAWRQKVLERQIEYGAKLGHVVLSMAKMELTNFYKNVMPVADYFDQRGMLIAINGERNPGEVYVDFRTAVLRILGSQEKENARKLANGTIPNGIGPPVATTSVYKPPSKGYPPVIWVIGGPGSNKYALCQKVVKKASGWVHLSVGRLLRAAAEVKEPLQAAEAGLIKAHLAAGNLVPQGIVLQLVETQMNTNMNAQGIVMDSFPRNIEQLRDFEDKFKQTPVCVLLDCSKLQLGRGRLDDSVAAFRKRLELFREHTLPMLKTIDAENRLKIIDGDTDTQEVRNEFESLILHEVERIRHINGLIVPERDPNDLDQMLQDLEAEDENIKTISQTVAAYNPTIPGMGTNTVGNDRRDLMREMYAGVETYQLDSNM